MTVDCWEVVQARLCVEQKQEAAWKAKKINKQYRPGRVATVILATVPRCMLSAVDWPFPVPLPSVLGD